MYKYFFKRIFDFTISFVALLLLSPILIIVTILLIIFNEGASAFFLQRRPGKNGRIFKIIKFRTMNNKTDDNGVLLPDLMRVTKLGNFIRKTSIDELPQLFNVLKGDMSLIGPRPLLEQYLPLYNEEQAKRHNIRPGITGWAQVNGRNCLSWNDRFKLDVWYVENLSLWLDIKIIVLTIIKVFKSDSINNSNVTKKITMENFNGSN